MNLSPGGVLGAKYLLVAPIAEGGMGQVWSARNLATGAEVAAKVLLPSRQTSDSGIERFRREARAMASLSHRAIVRVFDLVELAERGALLLVMERLRGRTVAERLEQLGPMSVEETVEIILPILSALEHAHGVGIVHRDLKPSNVLLAFEPDGTVMPKLLDFGISKMLRDRHLITGAGEIVGTPCYMSPEQACGLDVDGRSDLFSVGVFIYECLSGLNPFVGDEAPTLSAMMDALRACRPVAIPGLPAEVWAVLERALAQEPERRYATAGELARALREATPEPAVALARDSAGSPSRGAGRGGARRTSRTGALLVAGVLGAIATLASIGSGGAGAAIARAHPDVAESRVQRVAPHKRLTRCADLLLLPSSEIGLATSVASSRWSSVAVATPARVARARPVVFRDPGF